MATEVVTIQSVETKSGKSQAGKPWQLWKVRLEDGRTLSTFKQAPGGAAMSAIGEQREVDIEERAREGRPPDLMLEAVRPVPEGAKAKTPSGGTTEVLAAHGHVPPEVWEAKDRRMARMAALKQTVALYAHRDVAIPKTEDLLARASEFERWIYREEMQQKPQQSKPGIAEDDFRAEHGDEDIPF